MGKKSGGGIGLFGILFWAWIIYNVFFSGDNADDNKVEVAIDSSPSVSEQLKESFSDVKKELRESLTVIKKELSKAGDELSDAGGQLKEEFSPAKDEVKDVIKTEPPKEEPSEIELNPKPTMKKL